MRKETGKNIEDDLEDKQKNGKMRKETEKTLKMIWKPNKKNGKI